MKKLIYSIENNGTVANIRLVGHIGSWDANSERIMYQIDQLIEGGATDVDVYLNTYGGSVLDANEIINQLKRFKGKRNVQVGAVAASAGAYLLPFFHKVSVFTNTQGMVHDPIMRVEIKAESDFDSNKDLYMNAKNGIVDAFEKKLNISREEIEAMMLKTTWINAKKGKEIGLFDEIVEDEDVLPNDPENISNLYSEGLPTELVNSIELIKEKPKKNQMKEVLKALGLPENATEEQAVQLINSIKENAVKSLSALGTVKGFEAESIEKLANSDFVNTLEMVTKKEVKKPADESVVVNNNVGGTESNLADAIANLVKGKGAAQPKVYADYSPSELEALCEKDPEAYEKLINS